MAMFGFGSRNNGSRQGTRKRFRPFAYNVFHTGDLYGGKHAIGDDVTGEFSYQDLQNDPPDQHEFRWMYADTADAIIEEWVELNLTVASGTTDVFTIPGTPPLDGKWIRFRVTPIAINEPYEGAFVQSNPVQIFLPTAPYATGVSISGIPYITNNLTIAYTYNQDEGIPEGTTTFQWYSSPNGVDNWTPISGADSEDYTIVLADRYNFIRCGVTPTTSLGVVGTEVFSNNIEILNAPPTATGLSITGVFNVGETVTGNYTYNDLESDPESGTAFQWYRGQGGIPNNWVAISGATSQTYLLTASESGQYVQFRVTPADDQGGVGTQYSATSASVVTGYLSRVIIDYQVGVYNDDTGAGLEPIGTGAGDGYDYPVALFTAGATLDTGDITGLSIPWENSFNYRVGGSNIYKITRVRLYQGASLDYDSGTVNYALGTTAYTAHSHGGVDLNGSRISSIGVSGNNRWYPKVVGRYARLTQVQFDWSDDWLVLKPTNCGLEDETDDNGGTKIASFTDLDSNTKRATSLTVNWESRFGYRIGHANIYIINTIRLYREGVLEDSRTGSAQVGEYNKWTHGGINLNRSNVDFTGVAYLSGYPK
jgi:hypothetical protein